jgi:PadR family transcriptional regulator, regulatory protein PadR
MPDANEPIDKLRQELRRGVVVLAVLSALRSPRYGYSLIQALGEQGLPVEEGTLYPLMRRLEAQGWLESDWDTSEARPRKYYRLSAAGQAVLTAMRAEWDDTVSVMQRILDQPPHA